LRNGPCIEKEDYVSVHSMDFIYHDVKYRGKLNIFYSIEKGKRIDFEIPWNGNKKKLN
jgi:hypothetical protein